MCLRGMMPCCKPPERAAAEGGSGGAVRTALALRCNRDTEGGGARLEAETGRANLMMLCVCIVPRVRHGVCARARGNLCLYAYARACGEADKERHGGRV